MAEQQRAIIYIDGFNLYYGARDIRPCVKWLDLESLSASFLRKQATLKSVKLFTTKIKYSEKYNNRDKCRKQTNYFNALQAYCENLEIIYGHFLYKNVRCSSCRNSKEIPEEKCTDVNIASALIQDAYKNSFDIAYLVSGDSDLAKPVEIVQALGKIIFIASPPNRKSQGLISNSSGAFSINRKKC